MTVIQTPPPKATWRRKGLFVLHTLLTVHHGGKSRKELKQSRNMEAGLRQRAWRNSISWLAPHALLCLIFDTTQDNQSLGGSAYSILGFPTSIIKKIPYKLTYRKSCGGTFSVDVPFPRWLSVVSVDTHTKINPNQNSWLLANLMDQYNIPQLNHNLYFLANSQDLTLILTSIP